MKKKLSFVILSLMTMLIGFTSCRGNDNVPVTGIRLDKSELTLLKGESSMLTATVSPEDATDPTVKWKSSDLSIATVDDYGNVKAVAAGKTTVTVSSADGRFTATCTVNVNVNVSSLILSDTSITLKKGDSKKLSVAISPDDATNKSVTWSSGDTNIAIVDNMGKITAVNGGSTVITITSIYGKIAATCSVNVTVAVQSVSLDKSELTLIKGQTATLNATIVPSDATTKDVSWASSNISAVTVDNGSIKAVGVGTATISVTTSDGSKVASCTVTVEKSENIGYNPYGDEQQW
ncbi:Ig-like domain-containing protein [Hoylesella timonensis]|uniref:Ig-like domain-containing protein n=1 Tax=Hoylesella timonensis TaxID=386414 RepID=UPI00336ACE7A